MLQASVWLFVGIGVGVLLVFIAARLRGLRSGSIVSRGKGEIRSSGALVPWSIGPAMPIEALNSILPSERTADAVFYGESSLDGYRSLLEITSSVRESGPLPAAADFPLVVGPIAAAIQTLAGSERIVAEALGKGGFAVVKVPRGTEWMVAHGHKVAQAAGDGGRAGARARVVAFAGAGALAPEVIAIAATLAAEYVIVAKIEQAGRIASLGHQRQVSEALAAGTVGRSLVYRARRWSDDPRDWPDALVWELVDCHRQLKIQAAASSRMRDVVLNSPASIADGDGFRPAKPASGDAVHAGAELSAGYEVHASAAQVAAVRLEHALAHGDDGAVSLLLLDLAEHLTDLQEHHQILGNLSDQRRRWFQRRWGSTIESIADAYDPLVERMGSGGQFELTLREDGSPQLRALPPGVIDLPPLSGPVGEAAAEE